MARLIAVVLVLTLLAPAVYAEPQRQASPFAGWLDAFWSVWDRVSSWIPTIRSETRKAGAMLVPTGIAEPDPPSNAGAMLVPTGLQSAPRKAGAMLVPTGAP